MKLLSCVGFSFVQARVPGYLREIHVDFEESFERLVVFGDSR